jgi:hypothetical protein
MSAKLNLSDFIALEIALAKIEAYQTSGNHGDVKLGTTVRHGGLENCVICMDKLTAPRKLRCGHIFCEECIVG